MAAYVRKRSPLEPCAVEEVVALVGGKWKGRALRALAQAPRRFAELRRALPGVSQQVLATQLEALIADGLVARMTDGPWPVYALSAEGQSLMPVLGAVARWGERRIDQRLSGLAHGGTGALPADPARLEAGWEDAPRQVRTERSA